MIPAVADGNWVLINQFAKHLQITIVEEDFPGACQTALTHALSACQMGQWVQLQKAQTELANLAPFWGTSLLGCTIAREETVWAKELIRCGIDIHITDHNRNTPLHVAARLGNCELIEKLFHIDINAKNEKEETPLHVAILAGQHAAVKLLIQKGANGASLVPINGHVLFKVQTLGLAIMWGELKCIDEIIGCKQCNLDLQHTGIGSLLHLSIYFHQYSALEHLLSRHKALFALEAKNGEGKTPLSFAASLGEQEAVKLLHYYGASVDTTDFEGRTPMHHAALAYQSDTIQLLAALGAKIEPKDTDRHTPLNLIEGKTAPAAKSCCGLLKNLSSNKIARRQLPQAEVLPPTNLVLRGGGAKGLAFVGALLGLQEKKLLQGVERVAGTSAGAITSALVAINYPLNKLEQLLKETDLETLLLDHPFSKDNWRKATKDFSTVCNNLFQVLKTCLNPIKLITEPLKALYKCTGICEGEKFRKWIEKLIAEETGIPFLTFGELADLIQQGKPYKHLHIYGTRVGSNPEIVHINSQDPKWREVIISDAIRISMSIPGVFKPHVLHIKFQGKRESASDFGSFLDGGMLYNFPVETFDRKQFLTREDLGGEGNCPKYNKQTLGFALFSSLDNKAPDINNINSVFDLLKGIISVYMNAEDAIRQLNPYNASRVIEIDVKDVGTLSFNISDSKKQELVNSGREATKTFLDSRQITRNKILELPLIGITGLSQKLTPGLNIEVLCDTCDVQYVQKGLGTFNVIKEFSPVCCPTCKNPAQYIDFGFWDCTFTLKGKGSPNAQVERVDQIAPKDAFPCFGKGLSGGNGVRWAFLDAEVKLSQ